MTLEKVFVVKKGTDIKASIPTALRACSPHSHYLCSACQVTKPHALAKFEAKLKVDASFPLKTSSSTQNKPHSLVSSSSTQNKPLSRSRFHLERPLPPRTNRDSSIEAGLKTRENGLLLVALLSSSFVATASVC